MRLTIITDAWNVGNQVNGVVTTLKNTMESLKKEGFEITVIHPGLFIGFEMPGYNEIKLSLNLWTIGKLIENSKPDSLHIFTEGPLGLAAKIWIKRKRLKFTSSYHTRFPEYVEERLKFGLGTSYKYLRNFHKNSANVMVNTPSMNKLLTEKGFKNLVHWGRGVNTILYTPNGPKNDVMTSLPGPIWLNVGRVSVEKNLPTFYELDLPGSKVQVGTGPVFDSYVKSYPNVTFLGLKQGEDLAACYRSADYFVFPSVTDTFGLVMLESIASGVPVAAMPSTGPSDILLEGKTGIIRNTLQESCNVMIQQQWDRDFIREWALTQSWEACTNEFMHNLVPIR